MIDKTSVLTSLFPTNHVSVMDLVEEAGISTAQWRMTKKGKPVKTPQANPKFCYEWSFGGDAEPIALCIWHKNLSVEDGEIFCADNLRRGAEKLTQISRDSSTNKTIRDSARRKIPRARSFDDLVDHAFKKNLPVRAIIIDEVSKGSTSRKNRLLDDELWHVSSYDDKSGDFRIVRGAKDLENTTYFDQFSIAGRDERITTTGTAFFRSREVRNAVLLRAGGICEHCGEQGFMTSGEGFYLETHHVIPLSEGGADHVSNVVAICPNDHRKAHHSLQKSEIRTQLLEKLAALRVSSIRSKI